MRFELLVHNAMRQMRDLPDEAKYDLALRIYDVLQYQDHRLAKRYVELVKGIYKRDGADRKYAATIAAIWNVAKVIRIKDEPYVSYPLTRFEKKQRDHHVRTFPDRHRFSQGFRARSSFGAEPNPGQPCE